MTIGLLLVGCGGGGGETTSGFSVKKSPVGDNTQRLLEVEAFLQAKSDKWYQYYRGVTSSVEFRGPQYFDKYGNHVAALVYPGSSSIIINTEFLHNQSMTVVSSTLVHEAAHVRGIHSERRAYMLQSQMLEEIGAADFWVQHYRRMALSSVS